MLDSQEKSGESYFPLLEGIFFFTKKKTGRKWGLHLKKTALCFSAGRARCQNGVGENIPRCREKNPRKVVLPGTKKNIFRDIHTLFQVYLFKYIISNAFQVYLFKYIISNA